MDIKETLMNKIEDEFECIDTEVETEPDVSSDYLKGYKGGLRKALLLIADIFTDYSLDTEIEDAFIRFFKEVKGYDDWTDDQIWGSFNLDDALDFCQHCSETLCDSTGVRERNKNMFIQLLENIRITFHLKEEK